MTLRIMTSRNVSYFTELAGSFTRSQQHHWAQFRARTYLSSLILILILISHLRVRLPAGIMLLGFSETCIHIFISPCMLQSRPSHPIFI
jgi:hypothetical protein